MAFDNESLKVFLAVLDQGSFSAAARALGRVPSAVSMAIANLEAELNLQLFDRSGREPQPTAQALALVPQARLLATQWQKLENHALALTQGLESRLTLVLAPELLATRWHEALAVLAQEFTLLEVEVLTAPQADALALLHSGRAQLALVFERPGMDAREGFQEVGSETLVAVVASGHAMLQRAGAGLGLREDDLAAERQVVVVGRHTQDVDARIAIARQRWQTDTPAAALAMVLAGLGWAWLPRGFVQGPIAAGQLLPVPLLNFTNELQLWVDVVWSKAQPLGQAAQRCIALMRSQRPAVP